MVQVVRRRLIRLPFRHVTAAWLLALTALLAAVSPASPDSLSGLRLQLDRLGPGGWLELTGNAAGTIRGTAISRVFPKRAGHPAWAIMGPQSVVVAWSGAAYDTKRDTLFVFGGGHNDYGGNEVYLFDMARREWARVTNPSRYDGRFQTIDDTPVSRHTYDAIEYLPGPDRMFVFSGATFPTGNPTDRAVWFFDMDQWKWSRRGMAPFSSRPASGYDPATGLLYVSHETGLMAYDPARDHWRRASNSAAWIATGTGAFDAVRRYYVELAHGGTYYYDLSRASHAAVVRTQAPTGGDTGIEKKAYPGLAFDPARKLLFAWSGGRGTWSLNTRTFQWSRHRHGTATAPDQERRGSRGVYGRWRYVPRLDAFVGFNDPDGNLWLYRPPMVNGGN